ncbi:hypothetical protein EMPS_06525 [Entomortierella parvispora]|uniref:F-box domain-containing protein n=1 Tax=Entomortierella parvispora TaxID=205924 RepID=A0A9P3LXJ2_9FUNG|nr:hypothetical protein EMPS_06525 [Entomortierella parvispora]
MNFDEVQLEVAKYLDPSSLIVCGLVCKDWYSAFIPQLYHHIEFIHSPQSKFPRSGTLQQLAASLYRFRFHIFTLRLELLAAHIDRLLFNIEICSQYDNHAALAPSTTTATATTTTTETFTPFFPHLHSLTLSIYDSEGAELSWIPHCPQLQSLRLVVPSVGKNRRTFPQATILSLPELFALPLWSTTLTHLQFSGGTLDDELEAQILSQCTALTNLAICPQQTSAKSFKSLVAKGVSQSLCHLDMTERTVYAWVLQPILGSFMGLQSLSLSKVSVYGVMGVVPWPGEVSDVLETEWACTRLKFLSISHLVWCTSPEVNTKLLVQWEGLKELEALEILAMSCDDHSTTVLHDFPTKTAWNLDACDKPLPWMTEIWPRLLRYKSDGWETRVLNHKTRLYPHPIHGQPLPYIHHPLREVSR